MKKLYIAFAIPFNDEQDYWLYKAARKSDVVAAIARRDGIDLLSAMRGYRVNEITPEEL